MGEHRGQLPAPTQHTQLLLLLTAREADAWIGATAAAVSIDHFPLAARHVDRCHGGSGNGLKSCAAQELRGESTWACGM